MDAILGHTIISGTESIFGEDAPDDGRTRQEYDQLYKTTLVTLRGHFDVIFRNSSNGYYGGELYETEAPTGVNWQQITEDYSA